MRSGWVSCCMETSGIEDRIQTEDAILLYGGQWVLR